MHAAPPFVDDEGRLHHRGSTLPLNPVEARIARALTERVGAVVPDEELLDALRGAGGADLSLRTEVARLRARVRIFQLTISRSRGRGYLLMPSPRGRQ